MIENIATRMVRKMQKEKLLDSQMEEHNVYAMITLLEKWLTLITIIILALVLGILVPTVLFLLFFFSLRKRTGGYHASKFWICYIESNILYLGVAFLCQVLAENEKVMYGLLALAASIIGYIGTVNHPNMDMNEKEVQESKFMARCILLIELMLILALTYLKADKTVLSFMSAAIILCAVLLCFAKAIHQEI